MANTENPFVQAALDESNKTVTENNHFALRSTKSSLLDFYGLAGGMRNADEIRITTMFEEAFLENPLYAVRLLFYIRDIRGGLGERRITRVLLRYMAERHKDIVTQVLPLIPEFGRWDDILVFIGTPCESDALLLLRAQIDEDLANMKHNQPISLCAKWLKSINSRNAEDKLIAKKTAKAFGMPPATYRKTLSSLRAYLDVLEVKLSSKDYEHIDYEKVPSKAMLKYRNTFFKNDTDAFKAYLDAVQSGQAEIKTGTLTPYDLLHPVISERRDDPVITAQWDNLPDYVDADTNIICMVDTSGSMCGKPIEVALSLGLYFAEHNTGDFHDLFMTFSAEPEFQHVNSQLTLAGRLSSMRNADWGMNTDFGKAFRKILEIGTENHIAPEHMPKSLLVISDMEFDESCGNPGMTAYEEIRAAYAAAGYEMPGLIFWNVNSRANRFQVNKDMPNCQLASGEAPAVFKQVITALNMTPYEAMITNLNSKRYSIIRITVDGNCLEEIDINRKEV